MTAFSSHDVIVAGAGPVGLFLAGELRLAGCSVLVLEREANAFSPMKDLPFGLRGLSVPTIEALDRRGLLGAVRAAEARPDARPAHWQQQRRRPAGHFAGIQFFHDQIDQARWLYRLAEPVEALAVDMASLETILAERATALGVDIRRGCGVDGLAQDDDGVIADAGGHRFGASWLVGCDGGRSTVRKAAGIGFAGTEPEFTGYSIQATLADQSLLTPGRHYTPQGMYLFTPPGTIGIAEFDGGAFHRAAPITREHVEAVLRRVSGIPVEVTTLDLAATWTDRAYQAITYRNGRVLLAGDAAHVHSPLGGQGLNLGLGDAMNLGWKLAATIRGDTPVDLLDSYQRERFPIAEQVLDWSRAQVALMRPSPSSRAVEAIVRDLIATDDAATYFAERVWGTGLRYDLGDGHPLVGRSAPDFALADGSRLNDHFRAGHGVLLDFAATDALRQVAARLPDRLSYLATDAAERFGLAALLVRPDGIVAWASDTAGDAAEAGDAVSRWFGET